MPLPRAYTCNVYRSRRECKCACSVPLRHPPLSGTGLFSMNITAFTSAATKSQTVSAIIMSSGEDSPGDTLLTSVITRGCRKLPGGGMADVFVHARMEGCSTALLLYTLHFNTLHGLSLEPSKNRKPRVSINLASCKLIDWKLMLNATCSRVNCVRTFLYSQLLFLYQSWHTCCELRTASCMTCIAHACVHVRNVNA